MKERDIEAYLIEQVRLQFGETRKLKFIGRDGAPDRLVLLPGVMVFVELKSPTGRLSAAQKRELRTLEYFGAKTAVVKSKSDVDKLLASL